MFLPKFHIFSRLEKSWGGQRIRKFSAKMTPQGKKMTFFWIYFFCCTSSRRDETFLFLPKFHIFSRSEKSWGDKEKALHQRTNERTNDERRTNERTTNDERRTTNDERRTTLTMIIARQDSFRILGLITPLTRHE